MPTRDVTGTKVWVDESDAHHTRPADITVRLYADGAVTSYQPEWTGREGDAWSFVFRGVPAVNASGAEIVYTVDELPVDNYETTVSGTIITNRLMENPPSGYTDISGTKTWIDGNNASGKRPGYVIVRLLRDGSEVAQRTVTAASDWTFTFEHQPLDDGYGNRYAYTVTEDAVSGYFARISGFDITNTSLPDSETKVDPPKNPGDPEPDDRPADEPETPVARKTRMERVRHTDTAAPKFETLTVENLEDMTDILDYDTPLWGGLLGTGDETPVWPFAFAGVGAMALAALAVMKRRRRKIRG